MRHPCSRRVGVASVSGRAKQESLWWPRARLGCLFSTLPALVQGRGSGVSSGQESRATQARWGGQCTLCCALQHILIHVLRIIKTDPRRQRGRRLCEAGGRTSNTLGGTATCTACYSGRALILAVPYLLCRQRGRGLRGPGCRDQWGGGGRGDGDIRPGRLPETHAGQPAQRARQQRQEQARGRRLGGRWGHAVRPAPACTALAVLCACAYPPPCRLRTLAGRRSRSSSARMPTIQVCRT